MVASKGISPNRIRGGIQPEQETDAASVTSSPRSCFQFMDALSWRFRFSWMNTSRALSPFPCRTRREDCHTPLWQQEHVGPLDLLPRPSAAGPDVEQGGFEIAHILGDGPPFFRSVEYRWMLFSMTYWQGQDNCIDTCSPQTPYGSGQSPRLPASSEPLQASSLRDAGR